MAAIDTNVLVRFLIEEEADSVQRIAVYNLFENEQILIPHTVILETVWVLQSYYKLSREQIAFALRTVFGLQNVKVYEPFRIATALTWYESGFDFADALHLSLSQNEGAFYTFDEKLIKRAGSVSSVRATKP